MRKIYFVLLLIPIFSVAQQETVIELDSLLNAYKIEKDLKKAKTAQKIGTYYTKNNQYYKSIEYNLIGKELYGKLSSLNKKTKLEEQAIIDVNIGSNYYHIGDHKKAMECFIKAFKIIPDNLDLLNDLVILFNSQGNSEKAFYYLNLAEKIAVKTNKDLDRVYLQKSEIYFAKLDSIKGFDALDKSVEYSIKNKNFIQLATIYTNYGDIINNQERKIDYYLKSKEIWDKYQPNDLLAISNNLSIAEFYTKIAYQSKYLLINKITRNKSLEKAEKLVLEQIKNCKTINHTGKNLQYSLECLSNVYEAKNDFKNAHKYFKECVFLYDSLNSIDVKNKILNIEASNNINEKNKEIKLKEKIIEQDKKQKLLYFVGIGLLLIIGGLLFYQSRKRKQVNDKLELLNHNLDAKNLELDQANKAKTRFFGILNHDLRGPVANLVFFLQLQQESPEMLDEESIKRMQDKTMTGAENLLSTMEDILQWSKSQMENFKPQPKNIAVSQLFNDTKKVFSGYLKINFEYQNPDNINIFTDENYLKTIIRNLTSNAINVFTTTENPLIIWKAWQDAGSSYFSIQDNGPGANQEQFNALFEDTEITSAKSGLGLYLIRDMAKAINCEITVDSKIGVGTTFTLKI